MECRTDPVKYVGLLFGALLMMAACYVCVFLHGGTIATVAGWFGFVFFGFAFLKILWDLLRPATKVIISDDGIEDRRWRVGVVPWAEITAIDLRRMGSAKFLCLEVRDPNKYIARMTGFRRLCVWANGLLGYPPITVTFTGLSPSIKEAWEYIKTTHPPLAIEERAGGARSALNAAVCRVENVAMSWLSKILGYVPVKERAGIMLAPSAAWEVPAPRDVARFLRAVTSLAPPGSVLYLEGGSPSEEVRAYLEERVPAKTTKVAVGTIWPRPKIFHMSITPGNLAGLAELAERHALPELAVHIHVYKDSDVVLQWHDAGCRDPMLVSKKASVDGVGEFCDQAGVEHRLVSDAG